MATQPAFASRHFNIEPDAETRADLAWLRASALAQARLQVAVLAGNRRRALEQLDRLIGIDRQLERLAQGERVPADCALRAELTAQRLAIAGEKLALVSAVELPRLEPAFGAGMGTALDPAEPVEIVEAEVVKGHLARLALWAAGFAVLCAGVAAAAVTQF